MPATTTNTTVNIQYRDGSPTISQRNAVSLYFGDTVTLHLAGFPQGCSIDSVTFYENQVVDGVDAKNTNASVGSWTRSDGNGSTLKAYNCTGQSDGDVLIEDIEDHDDDVKYWYALHVTGTGGPWDLDPELVNKGKGGGL